jgi:hypothetical protein
MGGLGRVAEGGAAADSVTIIRKETTRGPVHGRSGREIFGTPDTTGELEEIGVKELVAAKGEEAGAREPMAQVEEEAVINGIKRTLFIINSR